MKKFLFLFFVFFIASCGQERSEMIIGKWKIEDFTQPMPDLSAYGDDAAEMMEYIKSSTELIKKTGYYEFFPDGKGNFSFGENTVKGRWHFNEDESKLFFKADEDITETDFIIEKMETAEMILVHKDSIGDTRIVLRK